MLRLRGDRSYKEFSKEIGISYGQLFKLENGYNKLKFEEFVKICAHVDDIELKTIFKEKLYLELDDFNQSDLIEKFCRVWGEPSKYLLTRRIGFTNSKWWRIKSGSSRLILEDFLILIEQCGCDIIGFLAHFLNEDDMKNLKGGGESFYQNELFILQKFPDAVQITTIIGDQCYESAPLEERTNKLREMSCLDKERFDFLLDILVRNDVLYLEKETSLYKKHQLKFYVKGKDDTYETFKSVNNHIMKKQIELVENPFHNKDNVKFACGVTTISEDALIKIKKEITDTFSRINDIMENDNLNEDKKRLAAFQLGASFMDS